MLNEKEVLFLYNEAQDVVRNAMSQVTIDVHVIEAEQHCKAYAKILEIPYTAPKRK